MKRFILTISLVVFIVSTVYLWKGFWFSYQQELAGAKELQNFEQSLSKYDPPVEAVPSAAGAPVQIAAQKKSPTSDQKPRVQQTNKIVVKSMKVDTAILEGKSVSTLNQGVWHLPGTATPDQGGNMVIAAHRWKWLPTSNKSFYDIDKVKIGDTVEVTWNGTLYTYKVSTIKTVTPDKIDILQNTDSAKLTLFSCAPLFSSKYRLVVQADLVT